MVERVAVLRPEVLGSHRHDRGAVHHVRTHGAPVQKEGDLSRGDRIAVGGFDSGLQLTGAAIDHLGILHMDQGLGHAWDDRGGQREGSGGEVAAGG